MFAFQELSHIIMHDCYVYVRRKTKIHIYHTGQCKRTGGCYNELVVAIFSTGGGV